MTYSADDFPPGSQDRIDVAMHSAGAACNPDDVITDWGHYDEDYTDDEQAKAWEETEMDEPYHDLSFPLADSLDDLYNRS
jgi:hypothetical protein